MVSPIMSPNKHLLQILASYESTGMRVIINTTDTFKQPEHAP